MLNAPLVFKLGLGMADSSEVFDSALFTVFSDRTISLTIFDPSRWTNLEHSICHRKLRADIANANESQASPALEACEAIKPSTSR
jgi:hypothetical protein